MTVVESVSFLGSTNSPDPPEHDEGKDCSSSNMTFDLTVSESEFRTLIHNVLVGGCYQTAQKIKTCLRSDENGSKFITFLDIIHSEFLSTKVERQRNVPKSAISIVTCLHVRDDDFLLKNENVLDKFLEVEAHMYFTIFRSWKRNISHKLGKKFVSRSKHFISTSLQKLCLLSSTNIDALPLLGCYLTAISTLEDLLQPVDEFVSLLVSNFISIKSLNDHKCSLIQCFSLSGYLSFIDKNQFEDQILPPLMKGLLRSPEIMFEVFNSIIPAVNLPLNDFYDQILKSVLTNISSKDERLRSSSSKSFTILTGKVDEENLQSIFQSVVQHFESSKSLPLDQRIAILEVLRHKSIKGYWSLPVLTKLNKLMQSESNEAFRVELSAVFVQRLPTDTTESYVKEYKSYVKMCLDWITGSKNKFSSQSKVSILRNLAKLPFGMKHESDMINQLKKVIEGGVKQNTQFSLVSESIASIAVILTLDDDKDESMKDVEKELSTMFSNRKMLSSIVTDKFLADTTLRICIFYLSNSENLQWMNTLTFISLRFRHDFQFNLKSNTDIESFLTSCIQHVIFEKDGSINDPIEKVKIAKSIFCCSKNIFALLACESTSKMSGESLTKIRKLTFPLLSWAYNNTDTRFAKSFRLFHRNNDCDPHQMIQNHPSFLREIIENVQTSSPNNTVRNTFERLFVELVKWESDFKVSRSLSQLSHRMLNCDVEKLCSLSKLERDILDSSDDCLCDSIVIEEIKKTAPATFNKIPSDKMHMKSELLKLKLPEKVKDMLNIQIERELKLRKQLKKLICEVETPLRLMNLVSTSSSETFIRKVLSKNYATISHFLTILINSKFTVQLTLEYLMNMKCILATHGDPSSNLLYDLARSNMVILQHGAELDDSSSIIRAVHKSTDKLCVNGCSLHFIIPLLSYVTSDVVLSTDYDLLAKVVQLIDTFALKSDVLKLTTSAHLPRLSLFKILLTIIAKVSDKESRSVLDSLNAISCCSTLAKKIYTEMLDTRDHELDVLHKEVDFLLQEMTSDFAAVRFASVKALDIVLDAKIVDRKHIEILKSAYATVHIYSFDDMKNEIGMPCQSISERLFFIVSSDQSLNSYVMSRMIDFVAHTSSHSAVQAATEALKSLLSSDHLSAESVRQKLLKAYMENLEMSEEKFDEFGRSIKAPVDIWFQSRLGVVKSFGEMSSELASTSQVNEVLKFLVDHCLSDRNGEVRSAALTSAIHLIDAAMKPELIAIIGQANADLVSEELLNILENRLENTSSRSASDDSIRLSLVILMGSMAKHLKDADMCKVQPIIERLIEALATPSQEVQEAVCKCLASLAPRVKDEANTYVDNFLHVLFHEKKSFGERKGSAYGIAGFVKGLGILSLKQLDIMPRLLNAIEDKKSACRREGALLAFEMICSMSGRLFEPYIVQLLPHLLICFGDGVEHVRLAADDTAKVIMAKLSAHGVKLVLPALLNALQDDDKWRTKTGAIDLLGSMAYCAPKQLSSCLPSIVPKLIEVLGDSHHKVQKASTQALKQIAKVIRNPEILSIVSVLIGALQDPSKKVAPCLQLLLETRFVHFIDAPSLALIMPVVQRAFDERSTAETRKAAAQIIGNMYSLTDRKDLAPYLPRIIPGLQKSLLDPVPDVRAVSARALGAMARCSGSVNAEGGVSDTGGGGSLFDSLLPWLMSTLTSEVSTVDRSGAAQGLAEVVGGLGVEKMHSILPDIIKTAERNDIAPYVKDGYLMMFIYMPMVFKDDFMVYIGQVITPILHALSDENEFVRATAYRAGQRMVNSYAETSVTLLLPQLESGLFDDNWRIRHSSVQLLGDLLYKLSGVSGKMSTITASDDDSMSMVDNHSHNALVDKLGGEERRDVILASLYIARADVALLVRQAALHVWKIIVSNTPRTLRQILPTLFGILLKSLASSTPSSGSQERRETAARTLGDLTRKLGERILPDLMPFLAESLGDGDALKREGVCIGLREILGGASRDTVIALMDESSSSMLLMPTIRKALVDEEERVRVAAASAFESLYNVIGSKALDEVLPSMIDDLVKGGSDSSEQNERSKSVTLDGLKQLVAIKPHAVLPQIIPYLISGTGMGGKSKTSGSRPSTTTVVNLKALAHFAPVAGFSLVKYLPRILPPMIESLAANTSEDDTKNSEDAFTIIFSILTSDMADDMDKHEHAKSCLIQELLTLCKSFIQQLSSSSSEEEDGGRSNSSSSSLLRSTVILIQGVCSTPRVDLSQYAPQMFRTLLSVTPLNFSADTDNTDMHTAINSDVWKALSLLIKSLEIVIPTSVSSRFKSSARGGGDDNSSDDDDDMEESEEEGRNSKFPLVAYLTDMRQAVRFATMEMESMKKKNVSLQTQSHELSPVGGEDETEHIVNNMLPGFCVAKVGAVTPVLNVYRESILNGMPSTVKELAAVALGEVIKISSADALKPSVIQITGPLIRILGDRFNQQVKTAMLNALCLLLAKVKDMLKPFYPQLQATFLKAMNSEESHSVVRLKASRGLSHLIALHPRPEPLFNDLINGVNRWSSNPTLRDTFIETFRVGVEIASSPVPSTNDGQQVVPKLAESDHRQTLVSLLLAIIKTGEGEGESQQHVSASAACLASLCAFSHHLDREGHLVERIFNEVVVSGRITLASSIFVFVCLKNRPAYFIDKFTLEALKSFSVDCMLVECDERESLKIISNGLRCTYYLTRHFLTSSTQSLNSISDTLAPFAKLLNHPDNEIKIFISNLSANWGRCVWPEMLPVTLLSTLLPKLVTGTKEKNIAVRSACECAVMTIVRVRDTPNYEKHLNYCLSCLDGGAQRPLQDLVGPSVVGKSSSMSRMLNSRLDLKFDIVDNTHLSEQ